METIQRVHPIEAAAVAVWAIARELRPLLVLLLAVLLLLLGYRPATSAAASAVEPIAEETAPAPAPGPAAAAVAAAVAPMAAAMVAPTIGAAAGLEGLTVRQLRQLAREAGHKSLARAGRRAELLAVLA